MEVWAPIQDWILGLSIGFSYRGPWHEGLGPNVGQSPVGDLDPRWMSGNWDGSLGPGWSLGPEGMSGSRDGSLARLRSGMEVWTPWGGLGLRRRSRTLILDWILGSRSGSWDGVVGPGMKVWDLNVGLRPGWRSRSWESGLGPRCRYETEMEV